MPDIDDILPPHSGPAERALAGALPGAFDIPVDIRLIWRPAAAPPAFLPWLAWALSVDDWDASWTTARKREVVAAAITLHRIKGTRRAASLALEALGYPNAVIVENPDLPRIGDLNVYLGGARQDGGTWRIGPSNYGWADYWIEIPTPITRSEAGRIAGRLKNVVPARCRLREIALTSVNYRIGDGLWLVGDDIALGNAYSYEV